jgi:hypothetical protein
MLMESIGIQLVGHRHVDALAGELSPVDVRGQIGRQVRGGTRDRWSAQIRGRREHERREHAARQQRAAHRAPERSYHWDHLR